MKTKKEKINFSHESVLFFNISWSYFSQIKGWSHEINRLCDRKYKHGVGENRKVLGSITDTTIPLGRFGLPFGGHCTDSKYHPKVGEY